MKAPRSSFDTCPVAALEADLVENCLKSPPVRCKDLIILASMPRSYDQAVWNLSGSISPALWSELPSHEQRRIVSTLIARIGAGDSRAGGLPQPHPSCCAGSARAGRRVGDQLPERHAGGCPPHRSGADIARRSSGTKCAVKFAADRLKPRRVLAQISPNSGAAPSSLVGVRRRVAPGLARLQPISRESYGAFCSAAPARFLLRCGEAGTLLHGASGADLPPDGLRAC